MGLEDLPDFTEKFQSIYQNMGREHLCNILINQGLEPIEKVEFGMGDYFSVGYVFGKMILEKDSEEYSLLYSSEMNYALEGSIKISEEIPNKEHFEYHVLERKK